MRQRKFSQNLYDQYVNQGECCYYCKQNTPFLDITRDHFLPVSKGNTLKNNKVFACRKCNSLKGDKTIEEFRAYLLEGLATTLKNVIKNDWKISQGQLDKFRWYTQMLKTTGEIIDNDYKPLIIFT